MFIRIAASLVISVGAISVANETLARGGGGFGGVRIAAPPASLRAAPFASIRSRAFRSSFFGHRRSSGGGSGLWDSGSGGYSGYGDYSDCGNYYPYCDSSGYGLSTRPPYPYGQPPYPPAANYHSDSAPAVQNVIFVVPYRPGCDTETQKVPSMSGGERVIRIVRC